MCNTTTSNDKKKKKKIRETIRKKNTDTYQAEIFTQSALKHDFSSPLLFPTFTNDTKNDKQKERKICQNQLTIRTSNFNQNHNQKVAI